MALPSSILQRGLRAAQPAATAVAVGVTYYVTDESVTEQSNGTIWEAYSGAGGGGDVTHTGALTASAVVVGNGTDDIKVLASLGTTTTVLHGNAAGLPTFGAVVEADITLADNTTNNASTSNHGFLKKLSNVATEYMDGTGNYSVPAGSGGTVYWSPPAGMRLSLTTDVYVTTSDVTAAATVYWTTVLSGGTGVVTGYNGSALASKTVQQKSLALGTITAAKAYNVYYDYDGDALALGAAWTNDTTPSETLADESGALVLSSDHTKLYLGVIYTTSTTTTEDSQAKRFVWNAYNQRRRSMANVTETANSWVWTSASFQQANANSANQLDYVCGQEPAFVEVAVQALCNRSTVAAIQSGIGIDSTSASSARYFGSTLVASSTIMNSWATYSGTPGTGRHFIAWLEWSTASGTANWYGDNGGNSQAGISGILWA